MLTGRERRHGKGSEMFEGSEWRWKMPFFKLCFYIKLLNERAFKASWGNKKHLKCSFSARKQKQRTSSHLLPKTCSKWASLMLQWQSFAWSECVFPLNPGAHIMMGNAVTLQLMRSSSWNIVAFFPPLPVVNWRSLVLVCVFKFSFQ